MPGNVPLIPVLDLYQTALSSLKLVVNKYCSGAWYGDGGEKAAIRPNAYYYCLLKIERKGYFFKQ